MSDRGDDKTHLIVHIVFRFDYGGLENGVCNVINALSGEEFRHTVIALTEATKFRERLNADVPVHALGKKPGKDLRAYLRLFRLLRRLKPSIVHTRNIGTMDCALVAFLAGVPVRIHGEHGWDVADPDGSNPKYRFLRRVLARFVHRFITVSADLHRWLTESVGIDTNKAQHIYNGVDVQRFRPGGDEQSTLFPAGLVDSDSLVIGSVTRFSAIKDPLNLIDAFVRLSQLPTYENRTLRLVMLGGGELHSEAVSVLAEHNLAEVTWLPGSRDDVADVMRDFDIFVLGSLREGISNTILEAMASGLPVIATDTGGNGELVVDCSTGKLVPTGDSRALADAIGGYAADPARVEEHGWAARERAVGEFSIQSMVHNYRALYADMLQIKGI